MLTMEQIKGMSEIPVYFARVMPHTVAVCALVQGSLFAQAPIEVRESFLTHPTIDEIAIIVDYDAMKSLGNDEAWAIMQHETAHAVLGHVETNLAAGAGNEITVNESMEFQADAYAAERVGGDVLRSALIKVAALMKIDVEEDDLLAERLRRLA